MIPIRRLSPALIIILSFVMFGAFGGSSDSVVVAGDWPQILGPQRNSQALDEVPLVNDWKANRPKVLWRAKAGSGYSGPAIAQGVAFLFDRNSTQERLTAVELESGKRRWSAEWPASYRSSVDPDAGPRAVPTFAAGRVICYGAAGDLVCVDSNEGKILWQRPLRKELGAEDGYFGAGSSPLVIDNVGVVNAGGKKGGIVGFDLVNGKTLWQATAYEASYSSPIPVEIDGKQTVLVVTRLRTVLLDAKSGQVLSEIDFGTRGTTVNAATPLAVGDMRYLLTASYGIGAHLLQISGSKLGRQWKDADLLASQYNSPVKIGDMVIGVHGREDFGDVLLRALNLDMRKVLWESPLPGPAHLIAVGQQLLQLSIKGELTVGNVSSEGFSATGGFNLAESASAQGSAYRAPPAFSNHVLVVRSSVDASGGEFVAIKLP